MSALYSELIQQPAALRTLAEYYQKNSRLLDLSDDTHNGMCVLTGMGASYHAAAICALQLNFLGIEAVAVEASTLVNYMPALRSGSRTLIYYSQSGNSGEVDQLVEELDPKVKLVAITNDPNSLLAQHATLVLPLFGGEEQWIASKTYINSLVLSWLLARQAAGSQGNGLFEPLFHLAQRLETVLENSEQVVQRLLNTFEGCKPMLFAGHGPHGITARGSAMTLSEWPKVSAMHFGIGAYRHGFIEAVGPGTGAVIFSSPGLMQASARELAVELAGYGACVLRIEQGGLFEVAEQPEPFLEVDEFLSPVLDILPIQLYADGLARANQVSPGFRYISKIVRQL